MDGQLACSVRAAAAAKGAFRRAWPANYDPDQEPDLEPGIQAFRQPQARESQPAECPWCAWPETQWASCHGHEEPCSRWRRGKEEKERYVISYTVDELLADAEVADSDHFAQIHSVLSCHRSQIPFRERALPTTAGCVLSKMASAGRNDGHVLPEQHLRCARCAAE